MFRRHLMASRQLSATGAVTCGVAMRWQGHVPGQYSGNTGFQSVQGQGWSDPGQAAAGGQPIARGMGVATAPYRGGGVAASPEGVHGDFGQISTRLGGSSGPSEFAPWKDATRKLTYDLKAEFGGELDSTQGIVLDPYKKKIEINAEDPTQVIKGKFENMHEELPDWLREGLRMNEFFEPTVMQQYSIPQLMQGKDVVGLSPPGTGKTLSYLIPHLAKIDEEALNGYPQIVILCPIRELCQQIRFWVYQLTSRHGKIKTVVLTGGSSRRGQAQSLWAGADILIATPGRLFDFLRAGDTDLRNLKALVFDEADKMLSDNMSGQAREIMNYVDPEQPRITSMWSATWPRDYEARAYTFMKPDRVFVRAGDGANGLAVNHLVRQHVEVCRDFADRAERIQKLAVEGKISRDAKGLVFVETKSQCDQVAHELGQLLGISTRHIAPYHSGMDTFQREATLKEFSRGSIHVLVATGVASRGIEFRQLEYVINFCPPDAIDEYVHRIGRVGRFETPGDAYTYLVPGHSMGPWTIDLLTYLQRSSATIDPELIAAAESAKQVEEQQKAMGGAPMPGSGGHGAFGAHLHAPSQSGEFAGEQQL